MRSGYPLILSGEACGPRPDAFGTRMPHRIVTGHFMLYNESYFFLRGDTYMLSILYLLVYLAAGVRMVRFLLPRFRMIGRIYLGLCLGLLLCMWLPAIMAFAAGFTVGGHLLALLLLALSGAGCFFARDRRPVRRWDGEDMRLLRTVLMIALPLTVLSVWLECTHTIAPRSDGLHCGQSTYGDLNLHLAIITSLRNAAFPADYSIFPGEILAYPFLTDSLSTTMMLFGMDLRSAVIFPSALLLLLTFSGYCLLTGRIAEKTSGARLAVLLFFLNGGLGFLYAFDMIGVSLGGDTSNQLQAGTGFAQRLGNMLNGYYTAPTNHSEQAYYNLRWSNIICDMLIPQRTTLGGYCMVIPCLYLLYDTMVPPRVGKSEDCGCLDGRGNMLRRCVLLGVMGGALPMIHTHSFAALAMISAGWMAYDLVFCRAEKRPVLSRLVPWAVYGVSAALLALPQLFTWTFGQMGGSDHFISFHFNWVNNPGSVGLRDGYLWFYIKNIGLPFLLFLLALLERSPRRRFLAAGAMVVFLCAEFIQFQPNEYDNNKLFYIWYMFAAVLAADYAVLLFEKLRGLRSRYVLAGICAVVFFASAVITVAREFKSDYRLFGTEDVETAEYIEKNTGEHAVFMTWTQHINPVSSLAGRTIVCGPDLWLWYHGFTTWERQNEIREFYHDPEANTATLEKYGVGYIMVGSYERAELNVNIQGLEAIADRVFESSGGEIAIYRVRAEE